MLPLLWGKGTPSFEGKAFSAEELICYPRPTQDPIPIMVGGSGEKRTLRLVAEHANACNLFGDPETVKGKVEALHQHCAAVNRDPNEINVTHLLTTLAASDTKSLRATIEMLRSGNTTAEQYAERSNAGTVEDLIELFSAYSSAGADHSIVALPDVALERSIETFGEIIASFGLSQPD